MQTIHSCNEVRLCIQQWRSNGESIAFVPTMGNLHTGHLSLVKKAAEVAEHVVVSIFVNPLQFNDLSDYTNYPRTLDDDLEKLKAFSVDWVFVPAETELYPQGRETSTIVSEPMLASILEGEQRPGHFTGVTTIVAKLFNIVQPDYAIFGEKDYQQLRIVQKMVSDLNMPINIIGMSTTREEDGLAMSSRNSRLDPQQRQQATGIYQVLNEIRQQILAGEHDYAQLQQNARRKLDENGFETEYVAIRSAVTLMEPGNNEDLIILVAARLGDTRLIDNLRI